MKKISFVVFLLLVSGFCIAADLDGSLIQIESDWANAYYSSAGDTKSAALEKLLTRTEALVKTYPGRAEPLIWEAIVVSTRAGVQNAFDALEAIHKARDLLQEAIRIDPKALDGSAYVNLGSLYYLVPGWPVAFGDNDKAEEMFQAALKIKPDSLDANYFYGDFLLSQGKKEEAAAHFKAALAVRPRPEQQFADSSLQKEAKRALESLQSQKDSGFKNIFPTLSSNTENL